MLELTNFETDRDNLRINMFALFIVGVLSILYFHSKKHNLQNEES
jgi:cbb3-type cytochrome oxidase subunit 3